MRVHAAMMAGCVTAALLGAALPADAVTTSGAHAVLTRTQAQKLAKAAVLTKADLPKFDVERMNRDASDDEFDAALYQCLGLKQPKYAARNPGKSFTSGALSIDSSADVLATTKLAKADFKALGSKKGPGCYEQVFRQILSSFAEVESVTVKAVATKVAGAENVFGYKIAASFSAEGQAYTLAGYLLAARVGQTEIIVSPGRYNGGTPSLKQSQALAAKLVKRVAAL